MRGKIKWFILIAIPIIVACFLIGSIVQAKYTLTKSIEISYTTSGYYFDVEVSSENITELPATVTVTVKNYSGSSYTDTDLTYTADINYDSDVLEISSVSIGGTLSGGSKQEQTYTFTITGLVDSKYSSIDEDITINFDITEPYTDTFAKTISTEVERESFTSAELYADATDYLGAIVNYDTGTTLTTDITWRIFYIDESNIYIISDDYVLAEDAPDMPSGSSVVVSGYPYSLYIGDATDEYEGSASWDSTVSMWNSLYLASYSSSTSRNARVAAYLLDTSLWNENFVNSTYANYAIGGPTIEMWVASWNLHGYTALYCDNVSQYGYYIGTSSGSTSDCNCASLDGYSDTLYFPDTTGYAPDGTVCNGYWMASPYGNIEVSAMRVKPTGSITGCTYDAEETAYRPVVCLSSSTKLVEETDETYSLTK